MRTLTINGLTGIKVTRYFPYICSANQITGFYIKCSTGVKWVNDFRVYLVTFLDERMTAGKVI